MIIFMMLKIPHDRRLRRDEDRITYHFEVYKVRMSEAVGAVYRGESK